MTAHRYAVAHQGVVGVVGPGGVNEEGNGKSQLNEDHEYDEPVHCVAPRDSHEAEYSLSEPDDWSAFPSRRGRSRNDRTN
jgi:hypothetical protein